MTQSSASSSRAPVWFVAHGGPPTIDMPEHPAHKHWIEMGKEVRQVKPKAIVFLSAHWQVEEDDVIDKRNEADLSRTVLINTDESNPMIYDFYGFPRHLYELKFASQNPAWLNDAVSTELAKQGYDVAKTKRGIDHGVWIPLLAAFGKEGLAGAGIPLVQVSLPMGTRSPEQDGAYALRLGRALRKLRDQGIAIMGGGQPVHNLGDFRRVRMGQLSAKDAPSYGTTFPPALTAAMQTTSAATDSEGKDGDPARWSKAKALFSRPDYLQAHPTSEHLLPALVALGAAHDDEPGVEQFAYEEGPLAWNMYRFG